MIARIIQRSGAEPESDAAALESVTRTHVGLVRIINEDRVLDCAAACLWAIADGMGGHSGGDLAAQAVVDELRETAGRNLALRPADMIAALDRANGAILSRNQRLGVDAGATVVAALADRGVLHIAWAGDSRCYRLRDGALVQLTHDHSVVQELLDAGLLDAEAADRHPHANVITRALGVAADPGLSSATSDINPGDRFLLCSDGLSRSLRSTDLAGDSGTAELADLADLLLSNALARDGSDNVSLVLIAA